MGGPVWLCSGVLFQSGCFGWGVVPIWWSFVGLCGLFIQAVVTFSVSLLGVWPNCVQWAVVAIWGS